ncbi:MAG TPA: MSHA biogenesis protein MshJ [Noviherbaspirillum sp.]
MKAYWTKLSTRIDALTLRERAVIFLMIALALVVGLNRLILEPQNEEQARINRRIQDERGQIARIRTEIQKKVAEQTVDPDVANRARLPALQQQRAQLQRDVAGIQQGLISPERMPVLLEEMLSKSAGLRLVSLKKLPAASLLEIPVGEAGGTQERATSQENTSTHGSEAARTSGLYRHGVTLTVRGEYLDMMAYLSELEGLSSQLLWGDLTFSVEKYPTATMTLTVYTLSLDKQWLHI